ncbi:endolytic transglycosylase MltG [Desulfonatronum lacustre]|uniref:endolytic transglycosylase MltG n=1 Tax=Desulfonatronum lacustre TaxID=66849 RepID=UPI0004B5B948|nr:endolytic transglycosylase MltG [Desulfonatronum lacustre]
MTADRPNSEFEAEPLRPDLPAAASAGKPGGRMRKVFLFLSILLLVVVGAAAWDAYRFLHVPPEQPGETRLVDIAPGMSMARISLLLERENIISNGPRFQLYARLLGLSASVQAGEFALNTGWTPRQILDALTTGRVHLHRLRIPEGLTWWQTGRIVEESGLASFESFAKAAADPELLRRFDIPADHAEGFLFPETYHLPRPRNQDARPIVEMMLEMFRRATDQHLWPKGRPAPETVRDLVILASLVEKETGLAEERERVAGVFANRLRIGMRLQCDPTTIYGLGPDFSGPLFRRHLDDPGNPYNTYMHAGLPPGPIASPGLASLRAALQPEEHNLFYFVSNNDGSHTFSRTLEEHNRAVRQFRRSQGR